VSRGPGSSVGKATELRTAWSGDRIPVEERFSTPVQTGPGAHPASCTMCTRVFPGGRKLPGRDADTSHPSSAEVKKQSRAIALLSLKVLMAYKKAET
jgi:hypothetical protein